MTSSPAGGRTPFLSAERTILTPNDFASLAEVEDRLLRFQDHYERARPRSNGPSPARILPRSWPSSLPRIAWPQQHDRIDTSP